MRRCLVVANQTLGGDTLLEEIRRRMAAESCRFHVLVPATPASQLDPDYVAATLGVGARAAASAGADDPERARARERVREELARLREPHADATGEVSFTEPLHAIGEGLDREELHELVGSTLPGEDPGRAFARQQLRQGLAKLRELGADVSGEVGVGDPIDAIDTVLHRYEFDEVILSTLPIRMSRWLARDLPGRIRRTFKLPVTHIVDRGGPTT